MKTRAKKQTTVTETAEYELRDFDIRRLLGQEVEIPPGASVKVWVEVPGGGDWSNEDLDMAEYPVHVLVTTTVVSGDSE